jgi:hypothetical protein
LLFFFFLVCAACLLCASNGSPYTVPIWPTYDWKCGRKLSMLMAMMV